jgi:hypothetical protein
MQADDETTFSTTTGYPNRAHIHSILALDTKCAEEAEPSACADEAEPSAVLVLLGLYYTVQGSPASIELVTDASRRPVKAAAATVEQAAG